MEGCFQAQLTSQTHHTQEIIIVSLHLKASKQNNTTDNSTKAAIERESTREREGETEKETEKERSRERVRVLYLLCLFNVLIVSPFG